MYAIANSQTIPFAHLKSATKEFSIEKSSPTLEINNNFIYGSNYLDLTKGDAVYVTCKENEGENIEFYLREKGSKNLLAQVSEKANAWFYYKADKNVTLEVFGIIGKNKYLPNPKLCTIKYLQGNASDYYYSDKDAIPQKILALAYGKPLAFSNLCYHRNTRINKRDTIFSNIFKQGDNMRVFGNTIEYTIENGTSKSKATELIILWKGYIDKAFQNVTLEDKQVYNEQEMAENGFPEILYSLTYKNLEQLGYIENKGVIEIFKVQLQAIKNDKGTYDIKFTID
ncbi:MAG: hypothetical protein U0X41_13060 [Chitinophagales bacterium]|jgi:hypothetical protein